MMGEKIMFLYSKPRRVSVFITLRHVVNVYSVKVFDVDTVKKNKK